MAPQTLSARRRQRQDLALRASVASPVAAYLAELTSPESRRTMAGGLRAVLFVMVDGAEFPVGHDLDSFAWQDLTPAHVAAIRSGLADRYKPATANKHLCALRGVLRAAWRLGLMPEERYRKCIDIKSVRGSTLPAGRSVSRGELAAIFQECREDGSKKASRDAALLAVLYGARRSEVVGLDLDDYDRESGELRIRGKGNKERTTYLSNGAKAAFDAWLDVRGCEPGPVFVAFRRGDHIELDGMGTPRRITTQAVYTALLARAEAAGVASLSPHDLRRTFAGDMLDAGVDISLVASIMGHASVNTTARYDRRPEQAKASACAAVAMPY